MIAFEGDTNITGEDEGDDVMVGYGDGGITGLCCAKRRNHEMIKIRAKYFKCLEPNQLTVETNGGSVGCVTVGKVVGSPEAIATDRILPTKCVLVDAISQLMLPVFKRQSTCVASASSISPLFVLFDEIS